MTYWLYVNYELCFVYCVAIRLQWIPLGRLSENQPYLLASDFVDSAQHFNLDSKSAMLHGDTACYLLKRVLTEK